MIIELIIIVICELIVLLGILIVYWAEYTNSYIHCHKPTEPCYKEIKSYVPNPPVKEDLHYYKIGKFLSENKDVLEEFDD